MAKIFGVWNPVGGIVTPVDDGKYTEPALDRERPQPRNGMPFAPYVYRGTDFTVPPEIPEVDSRRIRRQRKRGRPLSDPEWLVVDVPFCAPPEWAREYALEAEWHKPPARPTSPSPAQAPDPVPGFLPLAGRKDADPPQRAPAPAKAAP